MLSVFLMSPLQISNMGELHVEGRRGDSLHSEVCFHMAILMDKNQALKLFSYLFLFVYFCFCFKVK